MSEPVSPNSAAPQASAWERLKAWEHAVVLRWQSVKLPDRLHRLLVLFVRLGDGWGWALFAVALYYAIPWLRFKFIVEQSLLAVAISLPVYWALKLGFRRIRPFAMQGENPRVPPLDKYSFPSGHTMNNLAVAMTLAFHIHALWPLALMIPLSLGFLRVFYGVHYLSDITVGALLGALSSLGAHWLSPHFFQ